MHGRLRHPDTAKLVLFLIMPIACAATQPLTAPKILSSEYVFGTPPFQACHAPTLVQTNNHALLAAWFAGTAEGNPDVSIWMARKEETGWTKPRIVAEGIIDGKRYACWNPVLVRAADSSLFLFYKVGRSPREWFGMMKSSQDEGETWSRPLNLPTGFLGPIRSKPIRLTNGDLLCPSSIETNDFWRVHLEILSENTWTWRKVEVDANSRYQVIQPAILRHSASQLQILCRSRNNVVVESWSNDDGATWTPLVQTHLPNPNSAIDAVRLRGDKYLLVYNPTKPGIQWWTGRNRLSVALSSDGLDWQETLVLEDEDRGEFSYPTVIQTLDGLVHILYTWNRTNIKHVVIGVDK